MLWVDLVRAHVNLSEGTLAQWFLFDLILLFELSNTLLCSGNNFMFSLLTVNVLCVGSGLAVGSVNLRVLVRHAISHPDALLLFKEKLSNFYCFILFKQTRRFI